MYNFTLPEDLSDIATNKLADVLYRVSKGRYGITRARCKAEQLKESAQSTFGISIGKEAFKMQIHLLLEQIALFEKQLAHRQQHYLTTITGVNDVTAAVILGEVGSIDPGYLTFYSWSFLEDLNSK
nr:hypothetical protein [Halobacillus karajensis]